MGTPQNQNQNQVAPLVGGVGSAIQMRDRLLGGDPNVDISSVVRQVGGNLYGRNAAMGVPQQQSNAGMYAARDQYLGGLRDQALAGGPGAMSIADLVRSVLQTAPTDGVSWKLRP